MFTIALFIGIYSYIIFAIGLSGFLYKQTLVVITIIYLLIAVYLHKNDFMSLVLKISTIGKKPKRMTHSIERKFFTLPGLFLGFMILQALVNLIGTFGPELGFDALWYHLTLPKLYLQNHTIVHIPGGLLYYSDMPKLVEMLYTAALSFDSEILAKIISFAFGLLSIVALYMLSRKYFDQFISIIIISIFYANLVVGWQSITAYSDLARTFFEILTLFGFLLWVETNERKWLIESSVMLGLAITAKLIALGSLAIFLILIILLGIRQKRTVKQTSQMLFVYLFICLLIPLPWFIFSYIHTGNPVYPLLSSIYQLHFDLTLFSPVRFISDSWNIFTRAPVPVSPIYLIMLPFVIFYFRRFNQQIKIIIIYSFFGFILWYLTLQSGEGRYLLSYLPAFSFVCGAILQKMRNRRTYKFTVYLILFFVVISIAYRTAANIKYVPVIIGKESKTTFLNRNLNFSFGDFYDVDNFFAENIKKDQTVLLYGFHNLYYVDFPFIHESWIKKGNKFQYVATQNTKLPSRFAYWDLIYTNPVTKVNLYTLNEESWIY